MDGKSEASLALFAAAIEHFAERGSEFFPGGCRLFGGSGGVCVFGCGSDRFIGDDVHFLLDVSEECFFLLGGEVAAGLVRVDEFEIERPEEIVEIVRHFKKVISVVAIGGERFGANFHQAHARGE